MLKNRDITVPCEHCEKRATIYYDTDAKVKPVSYISTAADYYSAQETICRKFIYTY